MSNERRWSWGIPSVESPLEPLQQGIAMYFEHPPLTEAYIIVEYTRDGERRIASGTFSTQGTLVPIGTDCEIRRIEIRCGNTIVSKLKPEKGEWYEL